MTFATDIARYAEKKKRSVVQVSEEIIIRWFTGTIMATPVKTGRARGNWQLSRDTPVKGQTDLLSKSGGVPVKAVTTGVAGKGLGVFYMVNNLPYIEDLEFGSSAQAPSGMVRTSLQAVQEFVRKKSL